MRILKNKKKIILKKNILLVVNVQTHGNPALWSIYKQLKDKFDITISGFEELKESVIDKGIKYKNHSRLFRSIKEVNDKNIFNRIYFYFYFKYLKNNPQILPQIAHERFKFFCLKLNFHFNTLRNIKRYDFIINIDTEASYISKKYATKNKIPTAYFIYEFYANQILGLDSSIVFEKTVIEKSCIEYAHLLLSAANDVAGRHLLEMYPSRAKIVEFTICPTKTFSENISCGDPLKFYYHGALYNNRGLKEAILAMKDIRNAILYIRGFGDLKDELIATVKKNSLENKVVFLPMVPTESLTTVAAEFDVGLTMVRMNVINHQYAMGFKTFENMSAGLALILPASHPLKKLNDHYNVGLTYEDATLDNLTKIFQYCVDNPNKVKEWKYNSRLAY
jgi:hypothetical protein